VKSALTWLIILAAVVGGAGYFIKRYQDHDLETTYALERAELKRSFQKRAVGLQLLDADTYRREVGQAFTDYFGKLDDLRKKYPQFYDVERERKKTLLDQANGTLKEGQKDARDERVNLSLELFEKMRTGQYRPLYTSSDKTFRFDIYELGPVKVNGETRIRLSFVHWGAFGAVSYDTIEGNLKLPPPPKGKPIEEKKITADAQPPVLQLEPERWVAESIPGIEVGYYELPLFPPDALAVTLTFDFSIQSPGGSRLPVHIAFPEMPLPAAWKVADGQKWDAEVQTMSEDQLKAAEAKAAQK
jgi:hypothetical protein